MQLSYTKGEERLVKDCVAGKPVAQRMLYERYADRMMGVCVRYARDYDEAADVMQEGFLRVFKKLHTFRHEGSLEGWIRRVIVNVAVRHYQKNSRLYIVNEMEEAENQPGYDDIEDDLAYEDLLEMVQSLPDGYRVVFNLFAIEGYSHKEIAEELGISEGTSKSQLARARKSLQQMLEVQRVRLESQVNHERSAL